MQIFLNIPASKSAFRYFFKNPLKLLFTKDYILEANQKLHKVKAELEKEQNQHKATREKLITAQKELSRLKRNQNA